jgi:hypothetical protein
MRVARTLSIRGLKIPVLFVEQASPAYKPSISQVHTTLTFIVSRASHPTPHDATPTLTVAYV